MIPEIKGIMNNEEKSIISDLVKFLMSLPQWLQCGWPILKGKP